MTITNGYGTLAEFKARYIQGTPAVDAARDSTIEQSIQAVSRLIDNYCGRTFYIRTETHYYDLPRSNSGDLFIYDDDLLTISGLTNGDGTTIVSGNYQLLPLNATPKYAIHIKDLAGIFWMESPTTGQTGCITIAGTWGYCNTLTPVSETRIKTATSTQVLFVDDLDTLAVGGLATDDNNDGVYETVWTATTDFTTVPVTGSPTSWLQVAGAKNFPLTANGVSVTGSWGISGAPEPIKEACYLQSYRLFLRKTAPFGVAGSAEMGQSIIIPKLDPDVALMCDPYRRRV